MRGAAGTMLVSATLLTLSPLSTALAQSGTAVRPDAPSYWAVITGNAVNVRSGPSAQSAYPFGKLRQGDAVRVLKEEYGWARIQTEGNAFAEVFAFVPADRRVTLSADGKTATVGSRTELRAPNADAGNAPDKSWKQIGFVDAGSTLTVLGTADGEKESVYKVRIPASAEAWVNMQFIRRANENESMAASTAASATPASATGTSPAVATMPSAAAPASTAATNTPAADAGGVIAPANAPESGSPSPAPIAPDVWSSNVGSGSPAIPPLLGQQPARPEATATSGSAASSAAADAPRAAGTPRFVSRRSTFDDLEQQFKAVRSQPESGAEFDALRAKYEELAAAGEMPSSVKSLSGARAKQLSLMIETQTELQKLERTKAGIDSNKKGIAELVLNIQRRADFTAIGILNASAVYDGQRLPELYRICDPTTGATVAYVEPNADIAMAPMIGTLVGVKGGKSFDPALRLTVISPLSVDMLTLRDAPQVTKTESTRPIEDAGKLVPASSAPAGGDAPCPEGFAPAPNATP